MTGTSGRRVQLFEVSTLYGAATLAAALDAGQFGPRGSATRVLLLSNNAAVPEVAPGLPEMAGWDAVAARFDRVLDWNEAIRPFHPGDWRPLDRDAVLWQRLLRRYWELGDGPVELVLESVHAVPAAALAVIFSDADIHVYADGLMSYGPTRDRLPANTAVRLRRLLHLDLVPGLRPLLLSEYDTPAETVPGDAFRAVLDEITAATPRPGQELGVERPAVLLGQYLAALDILTQDEEEALHERMLRGAAVAGFRSVVFKPHPTAPAHYSKVLEKAAAEAGVRLTVLDTPMLAESVFAHYRPGLVVGCFSTALLTASVYYGLPVARVGTEPLLERITPYQNSNRVPLTLVDALLPDLEVAQKGEVVTERAELAQSVAPLLRTVGYCMQAKTNPGLRPEAERWLATRLGPETNRYFKRARLTALALPGGFGSHLARQLPGSAAALRVARRVRKATRAKR
ncbi:polysialyltransferase family glycosyltransferase [Streptomyces sp. DSM 44915]|uniref:Polysialyltransferase family glycosyltransferase n=1 Tax=Streptomyces chisholmiae TaxID=3075540 RepID=A0ABU2JS51_9ACTN|nr:polysialyltransferase family glycosyltransferase [Streptomyces sp. DSM 44915]MDT0267053.1 polysialyltransferase family glycosyltransferase [Streptomyces sp. DSM 44915]